METIRIIVTPQTPEAYREAQEQGYNLIEARGGTFQVMSHYGSEEGSGWLLIVNIPNNND